MFKPYEENQVIQSFQTHLTDREMLYHYLIFATRQLLQEIQFA